MPAAVLWDMDGTIVDTEPYWGEEEQAIIEAAGGTWSTEQAHALIGSDLLTAARAVLATTPVQGTPEGFVEDLLARVIARTREHLPWRPGALELLGELRHQRVPCALVTMSWTSLAQVLIDALPAGTFAVVITGDQVTRGKPHPEPYLAAAAALGVDPADCVAIEDSATGTASAVAAGVPTIGVPNIVQIPARPGLVLRPTLVGVGLAELTEWAAAARAGSPR